MKPDIKSLWIDALTSGAYKQAKGVLRSSDGHCCLGVLCDLHSKATGVDWVECSADADCFDPAEFEYFQFSTQLPEQVIVWAGLNSPDPYADTDGQISLSNVNDRGSDFNQIAEMIRTNL